MSTNPLYELASGVVAIWVTESGSIMLKVHEPSGDPIELAEHEALELAGLLVGLVRNQSSIRSQQSAPDDRDRGEEQLEAPLAGNGEPPA